MAASTSARNKRRLRPRRRGGARSCSPRRLPKRRSPSRVCASSSIQDCSACRAMSPMSASRASTRCGSAAPPPISAEAAPDARSRASATACGQNPRPQASFPTTLPEIRSADLSELVLDCAGWGESDPLRLSWLDPPAKGALDAARAELETLGALDGNARLTELGQRMRALPLPPRLARMMLIAGERGAGAQAAEICRRPHGAQSGRQGYGFVRARGCVSA